MVDKISLSKWVQNRQIIVERKVLRKIVSFYHCQLFPSFEVGSSYALEEKAVEKEKKEKKEKKEVI